MHHNRLHCLLLFTVSLLLSIPLHATEPETIDTAAISLIRDEGMNRSRVMEYLGWLTDVYGPRLVGSPGYTRAAQWARQQLEAIGLQNAHLDAWPYDGRGWQLERYSAHILGPQPQPLLSYPRAWSPGTNGTIVGEVVDLNVATDSALQTFRGKLKGKFVMISEPRVVQVNFKPAAQRLSDAELLQLANSGDQTRTRRRWPEPLSPEATRASRLLNHNTVRMCMDEGALALLTTSNLDLGTVRVMAAEVPPAHPDSPATRRIRSHHKDAPRILPQITVAAEHYNRLVRMLEKGERVRLEITLKVKFNEPDSGHNVIAEIPGSDLRDETVMIGAHLDSWHAGTGATDNGSGVAVCMEAMRILKTLGLQPRRTIRVGLWGGEEIGLVGSRAYVKKHFGEVVKQDTMSQAVLTPAGELFSAYFNLDNGTGKIRGVYMQGNELLRGVFRAWLAPFTDLGASTLSLRGTGSTDHVAFNELGLPGFQFIQDQIEYGDRTWHSTLDVYDRAIEDDLKQAAVIMAAFAYNAATRDGRLPRRQETGRNE